MTRINGQQARHLLDGTTPGPWEVEDQSPNMGGRSFVIRQAEVPGIRVQGITYGFNNDPELLAAAPALAETIAWLYGREVDRVGGWTDLRYELGDGFRVDLRGDRVSVGTGRLSMHFSRDEAVDLARALLAAAEEARR